MLIPSICWALLQVKYGEFNTAIQLFDECLDLVGSEFYTCSDAKSDFYKAFRQSKAEVFEKANRFDDALHEYIGISKKYPDDKQVFAKISSLKRS